MSNHRRHCHVRYLVLAIAGTLAVPACVSRKEATPEAKRVARPGPVASYFLEHYVPVAYSWHVLGPFPSPYDSIERDLLIAAGGEARARPTSGRVLVPPNQQVTWRVVTA